MQHNPRVGQGITLALQPKPATSEAKTYGRELRPFPGEAKGYALPHLRKGAPRGTRGPDATVLVACVLASTDLCSRLLALESVGASYSCLKMLLLDASMGHPSMQNVF